MLDKTAVTKIAQKHIEKGEIDKAIAELQKLLAEEHDPNIYNTIGDLYLRKKETENAIEVFKKAADIFREGGFYLKAIALYKKILNINPSDVPTLILSGELNAGRGLTGNASENFSTAVDILLKGGSTEKALDVYKKMIKVFPSNAALKIKAAELSVKIGYTEGAVKEYIEAATHYLDNGVTDKAQAFYHKAIELDPKNVAALLGLGRIAERQNNIEQALEYLKNALSIAPGNSNALLAYSSLAAKTGNTEEGRQCLIKLTEIEPSNTEYKKLLGDIYFKEGSLEKAWGQFLPYIDEAIRLQKWDEAAELLTSFRDVDPAGVRKHLITVYKGSGDKESAVKELRELAELYESENLITDALQIYKEILELTPSDESAEKKIRELEKTGEEEVTAPEAAIIKEEPAKSLLEEKLSEADFYIQQGLKEDALKIYEKLLFLYPDDAELKSRAESLKKPEIKEEVKAKPKKHRVSYI